MTDVSRRTVIGAGVAGLAAGLSGISVLPAAADVTVTSASRLYTRTRWVNTVGRWFTASAGGRSVSLQLTGVGDVEGARAGAEAAFTLTFTRAKAGPGQDTYLMSWRKFTPTSLFLVPDEDRRTYTAIVNAAR